jgi:hypothetical protein
LEAQPAQDESEVSLRICSRDMLITSFRSGGKLNQECRKAEKREEAALRPLIVVPACFPAFLIDPLQKKGGEDRNRTYLGR